MANNKYKQHLENLLKQDARFIVDEGELMGNKVKSFTDDLDEKLIKLLLQDEASREQFFIKIKDVFVFKASDFKFFLEQNKIDNSFTNYVNQIGLSVGGKFLKDNTDVVLDFPYKDCILEGGQSTEEGLDTYFEYDEEVSKTDAKKGYKPQQYNEKQTKRKEIFFNTVVAKDEIDRLLEPKAFVNITKYDADGESKPTSFTRDATINKKRDLPADTITDNLIIEGNNLLALHSLKEEFKGKVKLIYIDPPFNTGNDTFQYNDSFNHSSWLTFMRNRLVIAKELLSDDGNIFIHIDINETHYLKVLCDDVFKRGNFVEEIIWAYGSPSGGRAAGAKPVNIHDTILHYSKSYSNRKQNKVYTPYSEKYIKDWFKYYDEDDNNRQYRRRMRGKDENGESIWQKQYLDESKGMPLTTVWRDIKQVYADPRAYKKNQSHTTELLKDFSGGQKPEALLKRIIEMATDEGDIVLDFHLGTGTTVAVAHKLKRSYIGVEQMGYVKTFTCARLDKIVKGNQTGISKEVNWKKGGSFTYLELAKNNQNAKDQIFACNSYNELLELFKKLYTNYFLHYNLKIKEFKEVVSKEEKFKALPLDRQKEIFCKMLDNNQLYVNVSEMEDSKHNITTEDIALTKDFYQIKE